MVNNKFWSCNSFISKFEMVSESEVAECIRSMASKTCELDAIPTRILKQVLNTVIEPITRIVNVSLEKGIFASKWKTAIVHPILKKAGLDLILSNFRPVSNLSFISKVVEKLVLAQFNKHCSIHSLIPNYQSAYRANYSCETALTKIVNDILWAMEHQKITPLVAIDLSAAFDTVDHDILLSVLEKKFGVRDTCLDWFRSYLNARFCMVRIRDAFSSRCELKCSVPQGSLGGPSLFTVYASTIQSEVPDDIDLHGFADDHILKNSFRASSRVDEMDSIRSLERTLVDIKAWMDQNRLKMNDDKTEFIMFASKRQLDKCETTSIDVNNTIVKCSPTIKYLGALLDQHLQLSQHITRKCRTAMTNLQMIKFLRPSLTQETAHMLVRGLVTSHLDYCNAIFAGLPNVLLKTLQKVQNIAAKLVLGYSKYDSSKMALNTLHWLPVKKRIDFKILSLVHKCLYGEAPEYLKNLLIIQHGGRDGLRSAADSMKLIIPRTQYTTFADRSFSVYGPRIWNALPKRIREIENLDQFKKQIKTFLFQNNLVD